MPDHKGRNAAIPKQGNSEPKKGSTRPRFGRNKLPWLDGPAASTTTGKLPGAFTGDSNAVATSNASSSPSTPPAKPVPKPPEKTNPFARSNGSTPTLRLSSSTQPLQQPRFSVGGGGSSSGTKTTPSTPHSMPKRTMAVVQEESPQRSSSSPSAKGRSLAKRPSSKSSGRSPRPPKDQPRSRKGSLMPIPDHIERPTTSRNHATTQASSSSSTSFSEAPETFQERRRSSLMPLPEHIEKSIRPEQPHVPEERNFPSRPAISTTPLEVSPTHTVPKRNPFDYRNERDLVRAIESLEDLVHEAVDVAETAADHGRKEEATEILEDAKIALRRASAAPAANLMKVEAPLHVSSSSSSPETNSSSYSPTSSGRSGSPHLRRVNPKPIRESITLPTVKNGGYPRPQQGDFVVQIDQPEHRPDPPRHSVAFDFAFPGPTRQSRRSSPSSSSSSTSSVRSDRSTRPLAPQSAHNAPRDHVDRLLRPSVIEDPSRDRFLRRRSSSEPRPRRLHREDRPRRRNRHKHRRSDPDRYDDTPDTIDNPQALWGPTAAPMRSTGFDNSNRRYVRQKGELSVRDQIHDHTFRLHRHRHRQPIARNWRTSKKRLTAAIACLNTALLGIIVGIYAGEVPRIQYVLADEHHHVILGNVVLYLGVAVSTFITWPLPLLHGRKPYILGALAVAVPLQFPQALVITQARSPTNPLFRTGLLVPRAFTGLALGFANVNFITTLLDLFGASLQSKHPHQELVTFNDVRRHGGGMGLWLGIWAWCSIASLALGFLIGAVIIGSLAPDWGFYIVIMILALALFINVLAPETRRSTYRRSVTEVYDRDENFITRRVARGEVKLHISTEGPKYWFEEVWAGIKLTTMMMLQVGFSVLALYLGWIYAQIVLVIILLGALLSRDYKWYPRYVGAGVTSIAIGALLAVPLTKAGLFSRDRKQGPRTDSMTFEKQVTWSSHLVRRCIFTLSLPLMGLAYTVSAAGRPQPYMVPIVFAGAVGFFSILAIAECVGLIMETFDTCDLQPGVNTRHRLQSMAVEDRRRRTNYSSFPRVAAGIFASQTIAFVFAALATLVGGLMTRHIGAQASTGVTAGILLGLTILLSAVLWRWRMMKVIPDGAFGTRRNTVVGGEKKGGFGELKPDWRAVVIGNPSGKMRKMSVLEMGGLSRWTEIRRLNGLVREGEGRSIRRGL